MGYRRRPTNTVALRDPSYVLSDLAFDSWNQLVDAVGRTQVERILIDRFEAVLHAYPHQRDRDNGNVDVARTRRQRLGTLERLEAALDAVEKRWYLDVVTALTDLLRFPERVEYE